MDKFQHLGLLILFCLYAYRHWVLRHRVDELEDMVYELQEKLEEGETRE